jgi:acylphosphatase
MKRVRVHLLISGRVQGVYFRKDSMNEALRLDLKGWVKNLPDRRVEAVVEGEEENISKFIKWCEKGPPLAIVRKIEVSREKPTGEYDSFTILR